MRRGPHMSARFRRVAVAGAAVAAAIAAMLMPASPAPAATAGNGVDWFYTAPSVALFYLTRDGVQFSGRSDTNGSARSVSGTIIRTPSSEWAQGTLSDGLTTSSAYVHSPNWWADTPLRDFHQ